MTKLHLGSGPRILPAWVNVDNQPYPGVDRVMDVTQGLPFEQVSHIYAEHFLEHLTYDEALALLRECRRVLSDNGVLRVSTPNLDWVWASHYRKVLTGEQAVLACFMLNRAFRGWGHQFLYNDRTLTATLLDAGFAHVVRCDYGQSTHEELRDIEQHERLEDFDGLSHILILEASGHGGTPPAYLHEPRETYRRDVAVK